MMKRPAQAPVHGLRRLCAVAALAGWAGAAWGQAYLPVGPQKNVPVSTVTGGGWVQCYQDKYSTMGISWTGIQAACGGARLMLACRPTGSATLQLLAQAPRADVLMDTGDNTDYATTHTANGTAWYWHDDWSWGFAKAGDSVMKSACDSASSGDNGARLCWHALKAPDGTTTNEGGYRCGADIGLNVSTEFERIIYVGGGAAVPAAPTAVPALAPWALLALLSAVGAVAVGVQRGRRQQ